jgi:hypothetical protein
MSFRGWVFVASGAGLVWAWNAGEVLWLVGILVGYAVWMWARIPIKRKQHRAKLPSFTEIKPWRNP